MCSMVVEEVGRKSKVLMAERSQDWGWSELATEVWRLLELAPDLCRFY